MANSQNIFDKKQIRKYYDAHTELPTYFCPNGRFIHIPSLVPEAGEDTSITKPWWKDDEKYMIGRVSAKTRFLVIINTLTKQSHTIEVCSEETLKEIQERYKRFNKHCTSYTWKRMGKMLDMTKTLEENGIAAIKEEFQEFDVVENYLPAIHLYFNDDLSVL